MQAMRPIRSFVRREGRLTIGQQRALDQLWPQYGADGADLLDLNKLFNRSAPLTLEIGFGNGETLAHLAQQNPHVNYLGFEVHKPGVGHLLLAAEQCQLTNLRVIREDAVDILRTHLPDACVDRLMILFPDPWPKKRHHKRRLIRPEFAQLLLSKLKPGGKIQLATDWDSYAEHMLEIMEQVTQLRNLAGEKKYAPRPEDLPISKFERRGQRLGHNVWNLCYERVL